MGLPAANGDVGTGVLLRKAAAGAVRGSGTGSAHARRWGRRVAGRDHFPWSGSRSHSGWCFKRWVETPLAGRLHDPADVSCWCASALIQVQGVASGRMARRNARPVRSDPALGLMQCNQTGEPASDRNLASRPLGQPQHRCGLLHLSASRWGHRLFQRRLLAQGARVARRRCALPEQSSHSKPGRVGRSAPVTRFTSPFRVPKRPLSGTVDRRYKTRPFCFSPQAPLRARFWHAAPATRPTPAAPSPC